MHVLHSFYAALSICALDKSIAKRDLEVQRENGDAKHTYGRLPHESATGAIQDIITTIKKKPRYDGPSSTQGGAQKVKRKKESVTASGSGERTVRDLEVTSEPNRTRTTGSASSELRRRQNCATPEESTVQLPARQVTTNITSNAQNTSRSRFRPRLPRSMFRANTAVAAQDVDTNQHPAEVPTALPPEVTSARSSLEQSERAASGQPDVPPHPPAKDAHDVLAKPNHSLDPEESHNTFRQPGMTRRQSNAFVFDPVSRNLRESLSSSIINAAVAPTTPLAGSILDLRDDRFPAAASPYQLTEVQAQLLTRLPPQARAEIQAQRVHHAERLAKEPLKMRAATHSQFAAEMQARMEAQLNSLGMDDADFDDGLEESNFIGL
ncbi:hypothetical protein BU25DRAFT_478017 [Macroventuria anomochaeta]|uniref:Uncharacterized protein n=1 Tax=Macroventuria anomochaeta TaxID=301207 RepID=A0ACB6RNT5_9PLEO|nr:uncharacterized protein BU25DRAFT_478017 [Macroventuria anomochaeta]KAF2623551.1 hypothetical protein BU25DRAFT_478017 [Macroventuria anomochaeta]